jgi:hypothetical protein
MGMRQNRQMKMRKWMRLWRRDGVQRELNLICLTPGAHDRVKRETNRHEERYHGARQEA